MSLPSQVNIEKAFSLLSKKEKLVKPASVTMRSQILQAQQRSNYMNEYDRIQGIITGYADRFGGFHDKKTLINRQNHNKTAGRYAVVSIVNIGSEQVIVAGDTGS